MGLMLRPNSNLERRERRFAIVSATFAGFLCALALASIWSGQVAGAIGLGAFASAGFFLSYLAWQQAHAVGTLGLEVTHGQRPGFYEVSVRLNPTRPIRLTRLTAVLECAERIGPRGKYSFDTRMLFTATEQLFEGRATLGHGERLEKTVAFALPKALEVENPKPELHAGLKLHAEVYGSVFEHVEGVTLDLPVQPQVTLSQM